MSLEEDRYEVLCPLFYPGNHDDDKTPRSLTVIIIFINCIFLLTTSISNLLVVLAVIKRSSLRSSSNIISASQAGSNIVVFLLAQPTLIAQQIEEVLDNKGGFCMAQLLNLSVTVICMLISFSSVLGMAINQYLNLRFPSWYATIATSKTTATMVVLMWILITFTSTLFVAFGFAQLSFFTTIIAATAIIILTVFLNIKNYFRIRKYVMQVQQQLETPNAAVPGISALNISHHQKTVALVFYILATSLVTHVPLFSTFVSTYISGWSASTKVAYIITLTVAYISCSLHAAIYFRLNKEIRQAVISLLNY